MFSEELEKYNWEEITDKIYSKTESDVAEALSKDYLNPDDFMALVSPAAAPFICKPYPKLRHERAYRSRRIGRVSRA